MELINNKRNRNLNVELMRLIACLFVIGCHSLLGSYNDNGDVSVFMVYMQCFFADGVSVFWLILGFFAFKKFSYIKRLKGCFFKICIPALLWFLFVYLFGEFILGKCTFFESINHSFDDIKTLIIKTVCLHLSSYPYFSHYWYIETYILVIIFLPVLYFIYLQLKKNTKIELIYVIGLFVLLILNDITCGKIISIFPSFLPGLIVSSCYVLYGSIIYKHKSKFTSKKWLAIAPILFIVSNIVRTFFEINLIQTCQTNDNTYYLFWNTSLGLLNASLIFVFCCSLKINHQNRFISKLGSSTFSIYIIHVFIIEILDVYGVKNVILESVQSIGLHSSINYLLYIFTFIVITFVFSFIFYILMRVFISLVKILYLRITGMLRT